MGKDFVEAAHPFGVLWDFRHFLHRVDDAIGIAGGATNHHKAFLVDAFLQGPDIHMEMVGEGNSNQLEVEQMGRFFECRVNPGRCQDLFFSCGFYVCVEPIRDRWTLPGWCFRCHPNSSFPRHAGCEPSGLLLKELQPPFLSGRGMQKHSGSFLKNNSCRFSATVHCVHHSGNIPGSSPSPASTGCPPSGVLPVHGGCLQADCLQLGKDYALFLWFFGHKLRTWTRKGMKNFFWKCTKIKTII